LGQGRENSKDFLRQNPDLADEIELAVRQQAMEAELVFPSPSGDSDDEFGEIEDEI
jgi:recombination protein RecA